MRHDDPAIVYDFGDVNRSIKRQTGDGKRTPWTRNVVPTLYTKAELLMRTTTRDSAGSQVSEVRMLHGVEHMQFAGWDLLYFASDWRKHSSSLLAHMAGNAFNLFSMAAAIMALYCVVPMPDEDGWAIDLEGKETEPVDIASSLPAETDSESE